MLVRLLGEGMGGRLRADFRRFYGMAFPPPGIDVLEAADMAVFLPPESATWRQVAPQAAAHTYDTEIARSIEYSLRWLVWAKTRDGSKGRNMPEPITFPWEAGSAKKLFEADVMTTDEADAFLGWDAEFQNIVAESGMN